MASDLYGTLPDGGTVDRLLLHADDLRMAVLTYGAIIAELEIPDRDGVMGNVVLGLPSLDAYVAQSPYFGAVVGRYANRIARGRFSLNGSTYQLPCNDGPNSLHGGARGFDKRVWQVAAHGATHVALDHVSPDGEQGFPGTLRVRVGYTLEPGRTLRIEYRAQTDRATVLNLSNHSYWNLGGEGSGSAMDHTLQIDADGFTPVDDTAIPTGEIRAVDGTPFDFRAPCVIGARVRGADAQLRVGRGYDHNWVLRRSAPGLRRAARLHDPRSGRVLEVHTDQPGLQFYSGNFLDGTLAGPSGQAYRQGDAVVLETQHFPDSPNRPEFPSTVLRPGETFRSTTLLRFGCVAG